MCVTCFSKEHAKSQLTFTARKLIEGFRSFRVFHEAVFTFQDEMNGGVSIGGAVRDLTSVFMFPFTNSEPIRIVQAPQQQSPVRGAAARLDCKVTSDATMPVTVTWMKDNKPLYMGWR